MNKIAESYANFKNYFTSAESRDLGDKLGNAVFNVGAIMIASFLLFSVVASMAPIFFGVALLGLGVVNILIPGSVTNPIIDGFKKLSAKIFGYANSTYTSIRNIFKPKTPVYKEADNLGLAGEDDDISVVVEEQPTLSQRLYGYLPSNPFAGLFATYRTGSSLYGESTAPQPDNGSPIVSDYETPTDSKFPNHMQ